MPADKILLIGDHFISPALMRASLSPELRGSLAIAEAETPFPLEPFRSIAEVREASGSEEQMIEALQGRATGDRPSRSAYRACTRERAGAAALRGLSRRPGEREPRCCDRCRHHGLLYRRDAMRPQTAEFAVAMALAAMRGIPMADRGIRGGAWPGDYTFASAGFELEGTTCGLVGYGAIGSRVARILRGFGATVLVHDPYATLAPSDGVEQVTLDELLRRAMVVSLHARETAETRGLIGREQIALMPRGAVLVNCARGALLDYAVLEDALRSGQLSAAAADVFPEEPISPGSSLLTLPNFTMTPHIAGGTRQAAEKATRIAAEEVARFVAGEPVLYCANPEVRSRR